MMHTTIPIAPPPTPIDMHTVNITQRDMDALERALQQIKEGESPLPLRPLLSLEALFGDQEVFEDTSKAITTTTNANTYLEGFQRTSRMLSSACTQAFLVDLCLSLSFLSSYRIFAHLLTKVADDLVDVCGDLAELYYTTMDRGIEAGHPVLDVVGAAINRTCHAGNGGLGMVGADWGGGISRFLLSPGLAQISFVISVLIVKAIFVIRYLSSSPATTYKSDKSKARKLSKPFEVVIVSVTLHSALGFLTFILPLLHLDLKARFGAGIFH